MQQNYFFQKKIIYLRDIGWKPRQNYLQNVQKRLNFLAIQLVEVRSQNILIDMLNKRLAFVVFIT
jgi:4-hydroxyphenylpyruvate dioxygenase-like putative hemolysin